MIQYDNDILKLHVILRYDPSLYKYKFSWVFFNFHKNSSIFDKNFEIQRIHFYGKKKSRSIKNQQNQHQIQQNVAQWLKWSF